MEEDPGFGTRASDRVPGAGGVFGLDPDIIPFAIFAFDRTGVLTVEKTVGVVGVREVAAGTAETGVLRPDIV